jgi:tetratricopeptide (TPR) repeat protein
MSISGAPVDSPVFTLLSDWVPGDIARLKTDVFRERVQIDEAHKRRLTNIREKHKVGATRSEAHADLQSFRDELGPLDAASTATLVDLMLTYRALGDWDGMIGFFEEMPETLKRQILVREQLGFAYNRRATATKNPADRATALRVLTEVDVDQGPSSETLGLIGRIHKDQWKEALDAGDTIAAVGHLDQAIDAYRRGYMADQRDAYPGINLLTLLDIKGTEEALAERDRLLPVVMFAVEQRLVGATPDYWDHATMLELAVLRNKPQDALACLARAVSLIRETWEPGTTANNLQLIERSRMNRGEDTQWLQELISDLQKRART